MSWRYLKLPRKVAGSNKGQTQALAFADESLWLVRLAWSEMHGAPMRRWHLDETVRQVSGMVITDSRGTFDVLTRSESPQLRLRSARTGEEAREIMEQCAVFNALFHWVNTSTMDISSGCDGIVPGQERWRCTLDLTLESGKRLKIRGAPLFNDEKLNDINPSTELVAFDTLLHNVSLSEHVREIIRMKYE